MTARQQCLLYLSPWERGRSELAVVAFFPDSRSDCVSPGGIRQ